MAETIPITFLRTPCVCSITIYSNLPHGQPLINHNSPDKSSKQGVSASAYVLNAGPEYRPYVLNNKIYPGTPDAEQVQTSSTVSHFKG